MKTRIKNKNRFNYRHIICIAVTLGFAACGVFLFPNSFLRIIESVRDFGLSVGFYFCEMFGIPHGITPTVNALPSTLFPTLPFPDTYGGFKSKWAAYWQLWVSGDNFVAYLSVIGTVFGAICKVVIIIFPVLLVLWLLFKRLLKRENNDYNHDSKPLCAYKWFAVRVCVPVKNFFVSLFGFIRARKGYWAAWLCMWLLYFNAFTIVLEFLAFYLYFIVSFDFAAIYRQVYKLFSDLWVAIDFVPWWIWAIIGFVLFDRFRKKIAYARLNHMELRNRGYINARPLVAMVVGTMGKGKTTMLTDMCLSIEVMFRDKAFEKILENDMKFPYFPWINLENNLRYVIEKHYVYNLATVKAYLRHLATCFAVAHAQPQYAKSIRRHLRRKYNLRYDNLCFDYDFARYGFTYDNKLYTASVWEILEVYAQLYFIYIIESSLLVANFSIRTDCLLQDLGNFPLWNADFFHRDSKRIDSFSRHAHILDFDFLRLGKTIIADNEQRHALEFGVVAVSEIGKERRNNLELQARGIKASADGANQKNDGFNDGLKMRRQAATVDNFAFLKIISDEQRPESFGADARDMFDVISINERSDDGFALPFCSLGELLYSCVIGRFNAFYKQYRFLRGDNTLTLYLFKAIAAKIENYHAGLHNLFGYNVLRVQVESGRLDGKYSENKYFLTWKKIYSKRFATDCMSAFWEERALRSPVGLNDLREYETAKATWEELKAQNSYFVEELIDKNKEG